MFPVKAGMENHCECNWRFSAAESEGVREFRYKETHGFSPVK